MNSCSRPFTNIYLLGYIVSLFCCLIKLNPHCYPMHLQPQPTLHHDLLSSIGCIPSWHVFLCTNSPSVDPTLSQFTQITMINQDSTPHGLIIWVSFFTNLKSSAFRGWFPDKNTPYDTMIPGFGRSKPGRKDRSCSSKSPSWFKFMASTDRDGDDSCQGLHEAIGIS
jgi:hypothetical protein